ncbi:MAG: hypothetical protein FWC22_03725 [Treponema sp.]|nr:hypothetical protein [Treponema sp.]
MKYILFISGFFILIFSGCISLVEKAGRVIDGSSFDEKTIALYRVSENDGVSSDIDLSIVENKNKEKSVIISIKEYPMIKLRTSMPHEDGVFHFTSLVYLSGSAHGWIEFSMHLLGTGSLSLSDTASFKILEEISPVIITSGKIQRYDTRITGEGALTALRSRHERVTSLARWMSLRDGNKNQTINDFSSFWKPVLFPEIVSNKIKPDNWRYPDDQFIRAEDINWNTGYTKRIFSEELQPVRNSGTLLRDWEEALYWIYFEYEWYNIVNLFSDEIILKKIK